MAGGFADNILRHGKNGVAPRGALQNAIARTVRTMQHAGRTIYHWWNINSSTGTTVLRVSHPALIHGGSRRVRSNVHLVRIGSPSATSSVTIDGNSNPYPGVGASLAHTTGLKSGADDDVPGELHETIIGTSGASVYAGCLFEDAIPSSEIDPADTIDHSKLASGRDVLASQTGSYGTVDRLRDRFDHVWRMRRPAINWSCTDDKYVEFSVSSQAYRYIFDQTIGTGGTAPSATGPAITLPTYAAGIANFTTVRAYISVYAAMSGNTNAGSIAIANKDANGSMQAMQAVTNPPTIGGTGYAWYPSQGVFNPATHAYFNVPIGVAFDRICLGARSEGATDKIRIKAFSIFIYPAFDATPVVPVPLTTPTAALRRHKWTWYEEPQRRRHRI